MIREIYQDSQLQRAVRKDLGCAETVWIYDEANKEVECYLDANTEIMRIEALW